MASQSGIDSNLMREEARINRKRVENAQRRDRFLNARKRIMGVDIEALDAQVEEKRQTTQGGVDDDILEKIKAQEIERVLEASKEEERLMREFQKAQLKASWDNAAAERKALKAIPEPFLDPMKAGPSAAQKFAGSDPNNKSRSIAQQQQMRRWIQEQTHEKAQIKSSSDAGDAQYAQMLLAVEEIRDAADKEEKEMKAYLNNSIKQSNALLVNAKAQRNIDKDKEWNMLTPAQQAASASIDLRDTEDLAMDEHGRIIRRDCFRGYSAAQLRHIIQENEDLLNAKRQKEADGVDAEDVWIKQQVLQQQTMEQAHYAEHQMRESETQLNLEVLKQQMALQAQRRAKADKDRFGDVTPGFFNQFGQDCR